MNGMAQVSNFWVPNLCSCGHDYQAHNVSASPQTCSLCVRQGGNQQRHNFTADNELWPSAPFPASDPARTVNAGGFGQTYNQTSGPSGNLAGSTTLSFSSPLPAFIKPGMSFLTMALNPANQTSYTIVAVSGNNITIAPPGLLFNSPGVVCVFAGAIGSTMGGGRPPNGQRAG